MKRRIIVGVIAAAIVTLGVIGGSSGTQQPSSLNYTQPAINSTNKSKSEVEKTVPTCDGTEVTTGCSIDGIAYDTYIYHPAVPEKTHTETVTTYQEKITGYCTLCNDGTYSPSCATGRGACSHHDGVAQWNAPQYSSAPEYTTKTIVDTPAQDAYYEKVAR